MHCDQEHDLANMEPGHAMPDVVHKMGPMERRHRVRMQKDFCVVNCSSKSEFSLEYYVRVLLPIPVAGRDPCNWGVWVRTEAGSALQVIEVWDDDDRTGLIWSGQLANELPGYPQSLGLFGTFRFLNLKHIPYLTLGDSGHQQNQLITDQRDGVPSTRALEWLLAIHHPETTS